MVPTHTTVTHRFAVVVKPIARGAGPVVVRTEFTTLRCQCAAIADYSQNGVGPPVVIHEIITARATYAATVKLFRMCTVPRAVAQKRTVQTHMFAVTRRSILVEMHVAVV